VLRLRRLKWSLIRAPALEALEDFLGENLDYDLYSERFADDLAEILQDSLPEDQAEDAQTLAHEYARNEADAVDKVKCIAESRRNASLHEIERRRAFLGETLRRSVQEIEDGEYEVIETTPAQGKNVA
jgi:hypothetical protein